MSVKVCTFDSIVALGLAGALALCCYSSVTHAQDIDTPEEQLAAEQADREIRNGSMYYYVPDEAASKRELPNYSGREGNPKTAGEVFLWIPRTIFFPVYFVLEFVFREAIGAGVTKAEEEEVPERLRQVFRFGPNDDYVMFPVVSFDLGFRPTVGVVGRFGNVPVDNTTLSFNGNFGGINFVSGTVAIGWDPPDRNWRLGGSVGAAKFADGLFFGLGSEASADNQARYDVVGYDVGFTYAVNPFRRGEISLNTGYRYRVFGDDVSGTTIEDLVADGSISELPPAYPEGYSAWFLAARLDYDSRRPRPEPGSGVHLATGFDLGVDPIRGDTSDSWISYGAAVRGYLDVSGHNHTFSLGAIVLFSDAFRGEVPFTELPSVSGSGPMPGFVGRFLSGDSAAVANFQFTWPIWIRLDGKIHFAVGNVFDGHLSNFSFPGLRMSFGAGIQLHGAESTGFELMVGGGTETFEDGPRVSTVRFVLGASRDF